MKVIASTVIKDKKEKRTIYDFVINGDAFQAHYYVRQTRLDILHNGIVLRTIDRLENKSEYVINADGSDVKITAWIKRGTLDFVSGVGIEVDGIPLQHTVADAEVHIKSGTWGLYFLLFIFAIKCLFSLSIGDGIAMLLYFIPLVITVFAAIKYKSWTAFSIIAGLVLAVLEMIDFLVGIVLGGIGSGNLGTIVWLFIRVGGISYLIYAFRWQLKEKQIAK